MIIKVITFVSQGYTKQVNNMELNHTTYDAIANVSSVSKPTVERIIKDKVVSSNKPRVMSAYITHSQENAMCNWVDFLQDMIVNYAGVTSTHIEALLIYLPNTERKDASNMLYLLEDIGRKFSHRIEAIQIDNSTRRGLMAHVQIDGFYYTFKPLDKHTCSIWSPFGGGKIDNEKALLVIDSLNI